MVRATTSVTIDINARLNNLDQIVQQLKNATSQLNIDKETTGRIADIENRIKTLRQDATANITSESGFTKYFKELNAILTDTRNIQNSLAGGFSKVLSANEVQIITNINRALNENITMSNAATAAEKTYAQALQTRADAEQKLAEKTALRKAAEDKLGQVQTYNKAVDIVGKRTDAQNRINAAIAQRTTLTAEKSSLTKTINKASASDTDRAAATQQLANINILLEEQKNKIATAKEEIKSYNAELKALHFDATFAGTKKKDEKKAKQELGTAKGQETRAATALNTKTVDEATARFQLLKDTAATLPGIDLSKFTDPTKFNELSTAVQQAVEQMKQSSPATTQMKDALTEVDNILNKTKTDLENSKATLQKQNAAMGELDAVKRRIDYFFSLQNAINLVSRAVKSTISNIQELDKAMTETAIVTDFSVSDMWDQLPQYTEQANKLGVSISSLYESTTLYYQQGLKSNQAMELSVETMKMARIAGLEAATATDRMTNALRAFNMELDKSSAERVNDVYSKVASISASNVNELSKAMTKVASLASNVGMSFEQTTAYLATGIETTRESADAIGTALKTVLARFAEMKKDPTLQESVDGETVDVNKVETALRSVGIALRDSKGEFRSMGDVFEELNARWDSLTNSQQRYIATMAAGSRQQSRFIAMMSNNARTTELYTAAMDSAGASQQQYSKTLESLETKIQKLKNAWNEFTLAITNNNMIKGAVDIITGLIEALNSLSSGADSATKTVINLFTAIVAFSTVKQVLASLTSSLLIGAGVQNINKSFTLLEVGLQSFKGTAGEAVLTSNTLIKSLNKLSLKWNKTEIFSVSKNGKVITQQKELGSTVAKTAIFVAAIALAAKAVVSCFKQISQNIHDASIEGKLETINDDIINLNSHLKETNSNITELASASTTLDEYQEKLSNLAVGTNEWNEALAENNNQVLELAEKYDSLEVKTGSNGALTITAESLKAAQEAMSDAADKEYNALQLMNAQEAEYNALNTAKTGVEAFEEDHVYNANDYYKFAQTALIAGQTGFYNSAFSDEENNLINQILQELQTQTSLEKSSLTKIAKTVVESKYETLSSQKQDLVATASAAVAANNKLLSDSFVDKTALGSGQANSAADTWRAVGTGMQAIGGTGVAVGLGTGSTGIGALPGGIIAGIGAGVYGLGTLFANTVAENIERAAQREFAIEAANNGIAPEGLEYSTVDDSFTYMGETIEDATAIYLVQQEEIAKALNEISEKIAQFADERLNNEQSETLNGLLNGERNDLTRAMLAAPTSYEDVFKSYFGTSMEEMADILGIETESFVSAIKDAISTEYNYQTQAQSKALTTAMEAGWKGSDVNTIINLDADSIDVLNNLAAAATEKGSNGLDSLYKILDFKDLNSNETAEFLKWLNTASFDAPITGFENITDALEEDNKYIKSFAQTYYDMNTETFSGASQMQYLLTSSTYDDLNEEFDKLYKKNQKISGSDVKELVDSYDDLNTVLEANNLNASAFAEILTSIYKNELSVNSLTNTLIQTISKFSTVTSKALDMETDVESFGKSVSSFEGTDFMETQYEQFKKEVKAGAYGSNFIKEYLEFAFDTTNLDTALKNFDEKAVQDFVQSKLDFLKKISVQDGKAFWIDYAKETSNQIDGFTATYISDTQIRFDAIDKTYNELLHDFQNKYGVTESIANMMLEALLAYDPVAAAQIDNNSFISAISELITNTTDTTKVITVSELETLGEVYGKTLGEVETEMARQTTNNSKFRLIDYSNYTAETLPQEEMQFVASNTKGTLSGGKMYYDPEALRETLTNYGFDETEIDAAINKAVDNNIIKLGRTLTQYSTDENGNITSEKRLITADTIGDLETQYAGAITKADYTQQAETFVESLDSSNLAANIEAIREKLDETLVTPKQDKAEYDAAVEEYAQNEKTKYSNLEVKDRYNDLQAKDILAAYLGIDSFAQYAKEDYGIEDTNNIDTAYQQLKDYAVENDYDLTALLKGMISDYLHTSEVPTDIKKQFYNDDGTMAYNSFDEAIGSLTKESEKQTQATVELGKKVEGVDVVSSSTAEANATAYASVFDEQVKQAKQEITNTEGGSGITDAELTQWAIEKVNNDNANAKKAANNNVNTNANFRQARDGSGDDSSDDVKRQYDWLYNTLQKINKIENARNLNQKKLNLYLTYSLTKYDAIAAAMESQQSGLKAQIALEEEVIAGRQKQYEQLKAEAASRSIKYSDRDGDEQKKTFDLTQYAQIAGNRVIIDYDKITAAVKNVDYGSELNSEIQEYISNLESIVNDIATAEETIADNTQQLLDNMTDGESTYTDLISEIATALQDIDQQAIDKLERTNQNLTKLDDDIVTSLETSIDAYRQQRDNEDTESDLTKLRRQIAYLSQDTTGANKKQLLTLNKQLTKDTRSYQDQIADQTLEAIKTSNSIAAEQRQEQIDLQTEQLNYNVENGVYHKEAERLLKKCFNANNEIQVDGVQSLRNVMSQSSSYKGLTDSEIGIKEREMNTKLGKLTEWASANNTSFAHLLAMLTDIDSYLEYTQKSILLDGGESGSFTSAKLVSYGGPSSKYATYDNGSAMADGWKQITQEMVDAGLATAENLGKWYYNKDGSYYANGWQELEWNGKKSWYYFDKNGYMLSNTTTPDGYKVGADGAWDGNSSTTKNSALASAIKADLDEGKDMEAIWQELKAEGHTDEEIALAMKQAGVDLADITDYMERNNKSLGEIYTVLTSTGVKPTDAIKTILETTSESAKATYESLIGKGASPVDITKGLKAAGYDVNAAAEWLEEAGVNAKDIVYDLKKAGFTDGEILNSSLATNYNQATLKKWLADVMLPAVQGTDAQGNSFNYASEAAYAPDSKYSDSEKSQGWHTDSTGTYYNSQQGIYYKSGWQQLTGTDGNQHWFYFDDQGYIVKNGTTPDGYTVDSNGWWDGKYPNGSSSGSSSSSSSSGTSTKTKTVDDYKATQASNTDSEPFGSANGWEHGSQGWWYPTSRKGGTNGTGTYYAGGWAIINGKYWWFDDEGWLDESGPNGDQGYTLDALRKWKGFKTGGLANFTGPAWLDGTESKPELVLNATDTQNFIMLNEALRELMNATKVAGSVNNGSYTFDVDINVDELADDYDVSQLAQKVQQEIVDAMRYRNVVTIGTRK